LNALNEKVYTRDEAERYFITVLNNLQKDLSATVKAEIREVDGMFDTQKVLEYYSR
jgi:hypothetical protein